MGDKQLTGAEALVEIMIEEGVEFVFGLPGGNAIPIYDALVGRKVQLVLTRHEQGAVHMADGYARATGKVGVALVTSGPGATNTVTGLFTALMDSIPLVVICGQSPTFVLGLDAFQEADVSGITYPCVKHSYLVKDVDDIPRVLREAFYIASSGRPGPVLIDMPKDISGKILLDAGPGEFHLPGYSVPREGDSAAVAKAAKALKAARRPILLVGHGAAISKASREVRELVERMRIPAVSTLLGKGVLPESHELSLGMLGMHGTAYANKAMVACDLVMSIGSRWDDRIVGSYSDFCKGAVKIHVDIDPAEMDKVVKVDIGIVGDAKAVLSQLLPLVEAGDTEEWVRQVSRWRREYPLAYRKEGKVRAQHVIQELRALAGDRAVFTTDVGQHQMWAAQYVGSEESRNWITSGGAGTMGFGFPAAIGAQLGRPGELVDRDRRRRGLPDDPLGARDDAQSQAARQDHSHQQPLSRHGEAMAEYVLRRALLGRRPRGQSRFREAGRGLRRQGISHHAARRREAGAQGRARARRPLPRRRGGREARQRLPDDPRGRPAQGHAPRGAQRRKLEKPTGGT